MEVAVLGAGTFGRELAQLLAVGGHTVSLHDTDAATVMDAVDEVGRRTDGRDAADRIDGTTDRHAAVADVAVVFDTVGGPADQLRNRLADLEEEIDRKTVIAVAATDSGITLAAAGLRHPDRALGACIPDPLDATVVEVIVADQTSKAAVDTLEAILEGFNLTVAVVRDHPGLVSTRLALAIEVEAMYAYTDGIASVPDVDAAYAKRYGHEMGPLERADRAGLDRRLETLDSLADALGDRFAPPRLLRQLVDDGQTGRASGSGFYEWTDGEPDGPAVPDPDLVDRPVGPDDPGQT